MEITKKKLAWTIASSDSGGGAGIQADLKTFQSFSVHGSTLITGLTAQNSSKVFAIKPVCKSIIEEQYKALKAEKNPDAVKLGLLPSPMIIELVASWIKELECPVVCDPVFVATSGDQLNQSSDDCIKAYKEFLFPSIDLLTPNIPETEALLDRKIKDHTEMEKAAKDLISTTPLKAVLIKGGHLGEEMYAQDFYCDSEREFWLTNKRLPKNEYHGTGCTLSSAIAANIALGYNMRDSVVAAKAYTNQCVTNAYHVSESKDLDGNMLLDHKHWSLAHTFPWLTDISFQEKDSYNFPDIGEESLGCYPIVDSCSWLERLLPLGIKTVQLRIKDLEGYKLEEEIIKANDLCRKWGCRLFINDYWHLAIKHKVYGVHLGQEDIEEAPIRDIEKAGLRLGISTHSYEEASRAYGFSPSYIALGPIFPTTCKSMAFGPQGIDKAEEWQRLFQTPIVAIGGIKLEHVGEILKTGVSGIAVISDITMNQSPEDRAKKWLELF